MQIHEQRIQDRNCLSNRISTNSSFGKNDFDAWTYELLQRFPFKKVLDLCCGTGKQLIQLTNLNPHAEIIGVDLSARALEEAYHRLLQNPPHSFSLLCLNMDELHRNAYFQKQHFDLITCFYGLYYSKNLEGVLQYAVDHLNNGGTILIVGPYGNNNAAFYKVLSRHYQLPELVLRASTTFMEKEVKPFLAKHCEIQQETFVNPVVFSDVESVLNYWRSTIYYEPKVESEVKKDLEAHFQIHGNFVIEKHVMALIAKKA